MVTAQAQVNNLQAPYAQGDVIAAFTTGSGNELLVNLNTISGLYNGETWNLNSLLTGSSVALGNDPLWAVLGDSGGVSGSVYATYPHGGGDPNGSPADILGSEGAINSLGANITAANGIATPSASATYSFNNEQYGSSSSMLNNEYGQVGEQFSGSSQVQDLYADSGSSSSYINYFTLTSGGVLTYGMAVPEPNICGMLVGAGLLLISLRNQLRRKPA
jgi:hypothetical protein